MVVAEDAAIREASEKVLAQAGYSVVTAADGQEAAARYDYDRIGLVLLDLNMPFKHGWELYGSLAHLDPSVPIIIMTDHLDSSPTALMANVAALMEKPVDVEHLLKTVAELLIESANQPPMDDFLLLGLREATAQSEFHRV